MKVGRLSVPALNTVGSTTGLSVSKKLSSARQKGLDLDLVVGGSYTLKFLSKIFYLRRSKAKGRNTIKLYEGLEEIEVMAQ